MGKITVMDIKKNDKVRSYIRQADKHLKEIGFTEHGFRHAGLVADTAGNILSELDYSARMVELAQIAGYLHDIGNVVNREKHAYSSALLAERVLDNLDMPYDEISLIIGAIGNHDEGCGKPVNPVAAALIIADKSDVHCTRVRNKDIATFDIHDRVNYAAKKSVIEIDQEAEIISLELEIDTEVSIVMEYFEIFLTRMLMARKAAETLDCDFNLIINDVDLF
ncbi:HD domain-containing protein [Natroniella sulfidigena]|uniref:HD domain-containing protein n=1 Tax=Natroniella sulfidigena TaxID=723921 RepID=UPI00200A3303|nr:HD domain-containing protein [Natroniella sulfidigena]MCK8815970.1 HD domain-containing protein [Natroniella sulfidigena]